MWRRPEPGPQRPATEAILPATRTPTLLALLALALAGPADLSGQADASRASGARGPFPFTPALASPLEPATRLAPVRVARGSVERWVGLLDLGRRVPFWLRRPAPGAAGLRLAGAVAGGVFSRFDLETSANEFVEAHFRFALRLRASYRSLEGRLSVFHVSSHLGDEFLQRTARRPISTSREGLELLLGGRPLPGLRLYAGPGAVVRSTESLGAGTLRVGGEWRIPGSRGGDAGGPRPYVAAELYSWEEVGWEPMLTAEAGVGLAGGRFRLAVLTGSGPSRAEQFLREDETLWGLALTLRP